jgi:hypothetical protein
VWFSVTDVKLNTFFTSYRVRVEESSLSCCACAAEQITQKMAPFRVQQKEQCCFRFAEFRFKVIVVRKFRQRNMKMNPLTDMQ